MRNSVRKSVRKSVRIMAALAAALAVGTAWADVKTGVDAWNRGDYHAAVEQWRPLAIAGSADAQFNMGQAYKLGRGVPVDPAMAMTWYRRAAQQGHPQAEDNYGLALFTDGHRAEAAPWLEKSVARGEPRAELVLGTMLFNGDGVSRDYVRAYALMVRASHAGIPDADRTLAEMDNFIPEPQRREGQTLARDLEARQTSTATATPSPLSEAASVPHPISRRPRVSKPVAASPVPVATPTTTPRHAAVRTGGDWRVQLGAFKDDANAKRLWESLKRANASLAPLQPYLVRVGAITKLQAGPLPSAAAATRVCVGVKGAACLVIMP